MGESVREVAVIGEDQEAFRVGVEPADRKWQRNLMVARILETAMRAMDPQIPEHDDLDDIVLD